MNKKRRPADILQLAKNITNTIYWRKNIFDFKIDWKETILCVLKASRGVAASYKYNTKSDPWGTQ